MRGAACGAKFQAKNAARRETEAVVGRLSVDQVLPVRTGGRLVRDLRTITPALFADDEEKPDARLAITPQLLGRGNLRRQNALGVAGAATVQPIAFNAARKERG